MSMNGFTTETFSFLKKLEENNAKDWFDSNRTIYQRAVKKPADAVRADLGNALADLTGHEMASKQFRINRDLRFSKDKTPYNTHIRMAFWPKGGAFEGKDAQPPSFFVSVETDHIRFGTGCMTFSKHALGSYLRALETPKGTDLTNLLNRLKSEGFEQSAPDLAKAPRGFPKDNPFADLARHKGLAVWKSIDDITMMTGKRAVSGLLDAWKPTLPLWTWLTDLSKTG